MAEDFLEDQIYRNLPRPRSDNFDILYDEAKPNERKYNRSLHINLDSDTYAAMQDLVANKELPFSGHLAAFVRHCLAAGIDSLHQFLSKDTRTLWSALQASNRRLTAERYAVTADEQVKAGAELLEAWSQVREWGTVAADVLWVKEMIEDLPYPSWRRRMATAWLQNPVVVKLVLSWQDSMGVEEPEEWKKVQEVFEYLREVSGGD